MLRFSLFLSIIFAAAVLSAQNLEQVRNLEGYWKFEIGDNQEWSKAEFDDKSWEQIYVPATWEDEGFPGYDGYAWYRKEFTLHESEKGSAYFLYLGLIDDVDETYINGHFLGFQGTLPPEYQTAAHLERKYRIPLKYLNFNGKNVIAVRVYDDFQVGGIKRGKIGLYEEIDGFNCEIELAGKWKFIIGDNLKYKQPGFDDNNWDDIYVPSIWQTQGYKDIHGFAWYRNEFKINKDLSDERLILLLGKIDDLDETYLNGKLLGKTGRIRENPDNIQIDGNEWSQLRAYYIPPDYLKFNGSNVIAVRVYDGPMHGGIYEGPIGIVTRDKYLKWKNRLVPKSAKNIFELIFGTD